MTDDTLEGMTPSSRTTGLGQRAPETAQPFDAADQFDRDA
jgi:hypothetical protein